MTGVHERPDASDVEIRPIRPEDEALWVAFMRRMSWATRYKRGARRVEELTDAEVRRAVRPMPGAEIALVAVVGEGAEPCIAGVARGTFRAPDACEFMLVVSDPWQGRGIGRQLMQALMAEAARAGHPRIEGRVLATNGNMLDFVRGLGFAVADDPDDPKVRRVTCRAAAL